MRSFYIIIYMLKGIYYLETIITDITESVNEDTTRIFNFKNYRRVLYLYKST
jgi:hypothetical protein